MKILIAVFIVFLSFSTYSSAQVQTKEERRPEAIKLDEFGRRGDCELGARFDIFMSELSKLRAAEEREASLELFETLKFGWLRRDFGEYLINRKGVRGVIVFYADDQRFDIGKLSLLIREGADKLAVDAGIMPSDIRVDFGGYGQWLRSELWVMPPEGGPIPISPDERPMTADDLQD